MLGEHIVGQFPSIATVAFADFMLSLGHNRRNSVLGIGIGAYAGEFELAEMPEFNGRKSFTGMFVTAECASKIYTQFGEFRPGFKFSAAFEGGEYADFRKSAHQQRLLINRHPDNYALSISSTFEFVARTDGFEFGFIFYPGISSAINRSPSFHLPIVIHASYRRFTGFGQLILSDPVLLSGGVYIKFADL